MREWMSRLAGLFRRKQQQERLEAELELHRELLAEEIAAAGSTSNPLRELGPSSFRDEYYDRAGVPWLENLWKDIRFGARLLRKSPGFAAISILTVAIGIGGSTAMFCLLYHVVLRPLNYADADRLAVVWGAQKDSGLSLASMPDYLDFRAQSRTFSDLAAYSLRLLNVTSPGAPEVVATAEVSDNFFRALATPPLLGRVLSAPEEHLPVAVISHEIWQNRFASDPAVIGQTITIEGTARTIIGVMTQGFNLPPGAKIWTPFGFKARNQGRRADFLTVIGRVSRDANIQLANAEIAAIAGRLETAYPNLNAGRSARVRRLQDDLVAEARTPLVVLFAAVSLLLVIACLNIALLMLARGAARSREILIRASLGASRGRVTAQLLIEGLLISGCGTAVGVALAHVGINAWLRWGVQMLPRADEISVDGAVLVFAAAAAAGATLLFSLLPIRRAVQLDVASGLRSRGSAPGTRAMPSLVVLQAVLATTLLIGAGLLLRSLSALVSVDAGYRAEGVLTMRLSLAGSAYPDGQAVALFHERLLDRLRTIPGVSAVALAGGPPAIGHNYDTLQIEGRPVERGRLPEANLRAGTEDYLRVIGTPLLAGRQFTDADRSGAPLAAIVNDALVRRYFDGLNPIGRRIAIDGSEWRTIVGVMADVRQEGLAAASAPEVLVPMAQRRTRGPWALIRTTHDPSSLAPAIRAAVAAIDPQLPVPRMATLLELRDSALRQPKFRTLLLTAFAGIALLLACLGVYGMLSYSVAERTPELGVRMALGATAASVRTLVLGKAAVLALVGVAAGVAFALVLVRGISALLFGIRPHDPLTFAAAPAVVVLACVADAFVPARRATRVDPAVALRAD